jgi:hypothetical protein
LKEADSLIERSLGIREVGRKLRKQDSVKAGCRRWKHLDSLRKLKIQTKGERGGQY